VTFRISLLKRIGLFYSSIFSFWQICKFLSFGLAVVNISLSKCAVSLKRMTLVVFYQYFCNSTFNAKFFRIFQASSLMNTLASCHSNISYFPANMQIVINGKSKSAADLHVT